MTDLANNQTHAKPLSDDRVPRQSPPPTPTHPAWVPALGWVTRRFHPKGTDRLVRALHPPGNARPVRTVLDYDDGLLINIDTHSFLEWYIYFYGAFRPKISHMLNRMLREGQVAFDIGSNIGMHALVMANRVGRTGRVHVFEPDPHPMGRLAANLHLNGFDNVTLNQAAVSQHTETRQLYLHDETIGNFANASLQESNVGRTTRSIDMKVWSLDDYVDANPVPRLDVIKLLAQGEEWNALQGAMRTIRRFRPKIFFLWEPAYWARQSLCLMDAVRLFRDLGYATYQIEFGARRLVTEEIPMGQVLLAVPGEA
ncbi:MAG: FkbM family methyltransferase [Alphaproteobacteria bacterium]|nr:FkbM family methyltransferase [Alphaproteobacteria bacterium]